MTPLRFYKRSPIAAPAEFAFLWHERPGAFFRLAPPWERIELVRQSGGIRDGDESEFRIQLGPFRQRWVARHQHYISGQQFEDVQIVGPFHKWTHTHTIVPDGRERCFLVDDIEYELPGGRFGNWLGSNAIHAKLSRLFEARHRITAQDIAQHWAIQQHGQVAAMRQGARNSMRILLSGATGLVGSALTPFLTTGGHEVVALSRSLRGNAGETVIWDPASHHIDSSRLEGFDAVVHLAGENIATKRWSSEQKKKIRSSRVDATHFLCEQIAQLERPPSTLVCASAIGYYGDRGDEIMDETKPPATDFLAEVCQSWESSTEPVRKKGIRVVNLRIGVVLSPQGGALHKMLLPFKLGLGGVISNGRQYMSWVALDDLVGIITHCIMNERMSGPVNAVAPCPVTNREFTKTLGKVLRRPTLFPMPAFAARLAFGEMGEALLLSSTRVSPQRLDECGYQFRYAGLEPALRHLLGR
ncbi:MAG: TIGR01777 family oxidoreductase [Planctomycetota bacterium]|nr:TIGR01777 family oxidoreductase [Planctomycetota bacterium]